MSRKKLPYVNGKQAYCDCSNVATRMTNGCRHICDRCYRIEQEMRNAGNKQHFERMSETTESKGYEVYVFNHVAAYTKNHYS